MRMSELKIDYEAWVEDQNRPEPDCNEEPVCPFMYDDNDGCLLCDVRHFGEEVSFAELCYYICRFRMRIRDLNSLNPFPRASPPRKPCGKIICTLDVSCEDCDSLKEPVKEVPRICPKCGGKMALFNPFLNTQKYKTTYLCNNCGYESGEEVTSDSLQESTKKEEKA